MASIEEITARWAGTPPWDYHETSMMVVVPSQPVGPRQFPRVVAQFFDKAEEDFDDHATNGPRVAAAPVDIATLLMEVELSHELLRELRRVVLAGIFGIPEEESVRLREAIGARIDRHNAPGGVGG